ncbi:MAG: ExbD/TolR family protein [Maioricimonas sp. JB049]
MARGLYSHQSRRRRMPVDDDLDITPMIDVTFLLLILFMVTSTMKSPSALHVPPARHGAGVEIRDSTVISIFHTEGQPEIYRADGERKNGPVAVGDVVAYVQAGVAEQKTNVIIKADRDIPSGIVEEVARAAAEVEGVRGFFVGVEDKSR